MVKLEKLTELIGSASSYSEEIDQKELVVEKAKKELQDTQLAASKIWDEIHTILLTVAEERISLDDDSFKHSRLGHMLKGELEKARRGR